jgi:hypothetical protein
MPRISEHSLNASPKTVVQVPAFDILPFHRHVKNGRPAQAKLRPGGAPLTTSDPLANLVFG